MADAMIFGIWQIGGVNQMGMMGGNAATTVEAPKRRKRKPFAVVKSTFGHSEVIVSDLETAAIKAGCEVRDLVGKRLAFVYKVGRRKRIKSLRILEFRYVSMCSCCGHVPRLSYRLGGEIIHHTPGWQTSRYKAV